MKRLFDIVMALLGLTVLAPLLLVLCVLVWLQDWHSPFYIPNRVGRGGRSYRMVKLRSMIKRADVSKVDSTANNDPRITAIGRTIRRFKFDEIPQLWNVLIGDMSLVGPRPNVERETNLYTKEERNLLNIRPGITDISSIVFADEGSILEGAADPDLAYNQIIRPWKSRLGLLYVRHQGILLDLRLILLTLYTLASRDRALARVSALVYDLSSDKQLARIARRREALIAAPPPGASEIVTTRGVI